MMEHIRAGLWQLFHGANSKGRRPRRKKRSAPAPIRGNMRSVIVVKPENPMFKEAVFILSDEYIRSRGQSQKELMQQANEAVSDFAAGVPEAFVGRRSRAFHLMAVIFFSAGLVLVWFCFKM